jgi:predicted TPR repeat methyltransferase
MNLPDYSEFLRKKGMLSHIENEWLKSTIHEAQAAIINEIAEDKSIIEIGCATGNLAKLIKSNNYTGFDKNEECIEIAKKKRPDKTFLVKDIRDVRRSKNQQADIVCAFAIMKHFGLHEWDDILKKIISLSNEFVVFDMPVAEYTYDDGEKHGHHHVWMTNEDLMNRLEYLGLEVYSVNESNPVEPIYTCLKK